MKINVKIRKFTYATLNKDGNKEVVTFVADNRTEADSIIKQGGYAKTKFISMTEGKRQYEITLDALENSCISSTDLEEDF
jgi:cupin superfamily acireductone dioxygenase involved in methionine salvage